MTYGAALEEERAVVAPQCQHHWLIESPHGATSRGICRRCGERRQFMNSASDALSDGESIPGGESQPLAVYGAQVGLVDQNDGA